MSNDPRVTRTRARVLHAAYQVLTEVGFERATIDLLSERSGVARSTLYRHWHSREAILRDAFAMAALGRDPSHAAPIAPAGTPADLPRALEAGGPAFEMLERYAVTFAFGVEHLWGRMAVTMAVAALDDTKQRQAQRLFTDGTRRDFTIILEAARSEGSVPPAISRQSSEDLVTRLMDQVVAPLFYRYQFANHPASESEARELARDAWEKLVGRPDARERPSHRPS
jgi:AcrR family transcriptional regulator